MIRSAAIIASTASLVSANKPLIDAMKHNIQEIRGNNFDKVMGPTINLQVSAVWYFKSNNKADKDFLDTWDDVATQNKKQIKVMAFDCNDGAQNKKHCERIGIESTPHIRIYPVAPQPHFEYKGKQESVSIVKYLRKIMQDKVQTFKTADEFSAWKSKNPTKMKVVQFSDKTKLGVMLKSFSTDSVFARTIEFGFVGGVGTDEEANKMADVAGKNAKKTPVFFIQKGVKEKFWYGTKKAEKEKMDHLSIHDWINNLVESGMGDKVKDTKTGEEAPDVEVEIEKVRELHGKNLNDMCLKQKNICAIYLQEGDELDDKIADKLINFESQFEPKSDRGAVRFSWMWADAKLQKQLVEVINAEEIKQADRQGRDTEPLTYPTMIMVKPPRKKREEKFFSYIRLPSNTKINKDSMKEMVEKVTGGATYAKADVPKFILRKKEVAKKKEGKTEL